MKIYIIHLVVILLLTTCAQKNIEKNTTWTLYTHSKYKIIYFSKRITPSMYNDYIHYCAMNYGVDASLVKAIIQVESNYNPTVISKSNAVGLMQLKADTAGRDAYRLKGWRGEPSIHELKNAAVNIDLGTAYLSILQKQLEGIIDVKTRRYAIIVAYVNGLSALLKTFSIDRNYALEKINKLNPEQFYQHIQSHHPSKQAQRYLFKVNSVYVTQN
ncbi:Endo-type membrane-bound lytic murein transglycosylase A [Candidatus Blochmanniella chromaiodes str. 640]|uniref:peptidoglycan lytic exotransglycosylase n=1 Tax=Candidatus Blochmanniella chromaiodes str. 640 TaxID=1240471 RepID=A0ABM5NDG6_9ENTR|nr:transglycosylase SLT domain-containing protein [Candidatus Blochmannia chromaiodes]AGC03669.1 Endo-type membrane-bound lytic murein transglycosylase A [Candidatus Blochmannia chromaiodes str. 640]